MPVRRLARPTNPFVSGGFFGRGPGEGSIKTTLPDAHNDFIFAVIAEEYGVAACLALLVLFAVIVFRALARAVLEPDLANRYAVCGLALLIGYQALINMAVNVGLLPAKGMTLPMVSAGGSSIIGVSITLGMLLAISHGAGPARPAGRLRRSATGRSTTMHSTWAIGTEETHAMTKTIMLAAGGSGGHLFPAMALAEELGRRGYIVDLATDPRCDRYGTNFPARNVHRIPSATVESRSPLALTKTAVTLAGGVRKAHKIIGEVAAGGRGRLRRISEFSASGGSGAALNSDGAARAECRSRAGQPHARQSRHGDCDIVRECEVHYGGACRARYA